MSRSFPSRVAFCISGHGYGHGVRSSQVINRLPEAWDVTVYSSLPRSFFQRELTHCHTHVECRLDVGCVQTDAMEVDIGATFEAYAALEGRRERMIEEMAERLVREGARLVVGDIPPLAFAAARRAGIPSMALGNFTWCEIYAEYVAAEPRFADLLPRIRADYACADLYARLEPGMSGHPFARVEDVGLLSREARHGRSWLAGHLGLDPARRWCLVYMGNYGIRGIDWRGLAAFRQWEFLGLYPLEGAPHDYHLIALDGSFGYADLTAACDAVLGKLGYGLVSECLHLARPIVYPSRRWFREHAVLAAAMGSRGLGREVSMADLASLRLGPSLEWARGARGTPLPAPAAERVVALMATLAAG